MKRKIDRSDARPGAFRQLAARAEGSDSTPSQTPRVCPARAAVCAPSGLGGVPAPQRGSRAILGLCTHHFHLSAICTITAIFALQMGGRKWCRIKQVVACALLRLTSPRSAGRLSILPGGRNFRPCAMLGGRNGEKYAQNPAVQPFPKVAVKGVYEKFWRLL